MRSWTITPLIAISAACAGGPSVPPARFANQPIVWKVDDQRTARPTPTSSLALISYDFYTRSFQRPLTKGLELPRPQRARGVNALDDVPDSTWFTNRVGTQTLTPDQIKTGPLAHDSPEDHKPWKVQSTKFGGASVGLIIKDALGVKYLLKFENAGFPEVQTGADVVTNRLLWAAGLNVPEDRVVYFRPEDLVLAPDAVVKNVLGTPKRPLRAPELASDLDKLDRTPDGRIRAVASRWIEGTRLGPTAVEGVRADDLNDVIPHQHRRDLRGAYAIYAWLDYVDLPLGQAVDFLVKDEHGRQFVKHYHIDFDSALGAMGAIDHAPRIGFAYQFDWRDTIAETVTLGLRPRPWLGRKAPPLLGVATYFTVDGFDPGAWKTDIPFAAFGEADRFDKLWGAKIVARFTRAQIRAAVEAGRYSEPRAIDYLTDTLVARQRAVVGYWFARVSPLDHVTATPAGLCFEDLAITYGYAAAKTTEYAFSSYDRDGRPLARATIAAAATGPTCLKTLALAADHHDDYTIVEILTTRPGYEQTLYVHLARDPATKQPRVIGIWRI